MLISYSGTEIMLLSKGMNICTLLRLLEVGQKTLQLLKIVAQLVSQAAAPAAC